MREQDAWAAVEARDERADGRFVFAVTTTRIFCRPSCPARRPRRENVKFFPDAESAEAAGFRACRRCRPKAELAPKLQMARRACVLIERAAARGERLSLEELGDALGVTPWHAQRVFKEAIGVSPAEYARGLRAEALRSRLGEGADVARATYEAGFGSASRLYEAANAELGMTPAAWRRGGRGETVTWTIARAAIGRVLIAATARGVCAVRLGDDDRALEAELRNELPHATLVRGELPFVDEIVRRASGAAPSDALPVDIRATGFTRAVWRALCAIPRGETRTYGEVASALGRPAAARAVAQACASNNLAVIIPCHRVVPASGGTGGYRWGESRKRALLDRER
ncbi:MAG TPA: bifunctional DNA-binding transcriptional regulator/O6-methylguanine-DNA methyltransferase Ada [Kofleriaceae bacterium]|nr:bifunctional DNA-binding transcriptional regulator/O6-methylguanine-DNA methyltransferase Ada [Kofleriaceae bacterium]